MVRAATAVLALLLAPGCRGERHDGRPTRVACLGDSNTFALPPKTGVGWCELLDVRFDGEGWKARNFSYMGGTVSGEPTAAYTTAADHIARAEAAWNPDVYVLAYGTNDLKHLAPAEVVAAYERHRDALIARGHRVLVATTPPRFPPASPDAGVTVLNSLLRQRIPPRDLVDFDSIADTADYDVDGVRLLERDGIHINLQGQEKRARAAHEALVR